VRVELTPRGDLIIPADMAAACFGEADAVLVVPRGGELWAMAMGPRAIGGLMLKRRNARGDRSGLVVEQLPAAGWDAGERAAAWDAEERALRVPLRAGAGRPA